MDRATPHIGSTMIYFARDLQPHMVEEFGRYPRDVHIGALDAPQFLLSGACRHAGGEKNGWPVQGLISRDMLDDYDYTDRTARVTDCASEGM